MSADHTRPGPATFHRLGAGPRPSFHSRSRWTRVGLGPRWGPTGLHAWPV